MLQFIVRNAYALVRSGLFICVKVHNVDVAAHNASNAPMLYHNVFKAVFETVLAASQKRVNIYLLALHQSD